MRQEEDEDQRVRKLIGEITKLLPERSKIKTDLLYFKYAPILVMLMRWYGVSQFYDNKMEITLWYEENVRNVRSVRTDVDSTTSTMIGTTRTAMVKEVVAATMVAVASV